MKKLLLFIIIMFSLTGCSANQENIDTTTILNVNSTDSSSTSQTSSSKEDKYALKKFSAQKSTGTEIDSYDFETTYAMCVQALSEYRYARVNKKSMDFYKYIEDENLISYMQKKLNSPNWCMYEGEVKRTGLIDFKVQQENTTGFDTDRLYLHIAWGNMRDSSSGGFSTSVEFIVKNSNGKLVIADWYDCGKDTFDTIFRGGLDIKKDNIYWNTIETLTIKELQNLVQKKQDKLTFTDFQKYKQIDVGSGIYIFKYTIDDKFTLQIGGKDLTNYPDYIYLINNDGKKIDIRYESISEFIN